MIRDTDSNLQIPVGRQHLAACLTKPKLGSSPFAPPVVICCHGLTGTRQGSSYRFVALARRLAAERIATLRFDFRGCGESDGDFREVTAATCREDLAAIITTLDRTPGIDPTRIGIVGSSFGCFTAAHLAAQMPGLKCLAFWAPVSDPRALSERDMAGGGWEFLKTHAYVDHHGLPLARLFFDTLPERDGPTMLAESPRPLLIQHGVGDKQVPIDQGRAYEAAMKACGTEVQLHPLETSDHGMRSVTFNETIVAETAAWMRRFLHPDG